MLNKVAIVGRPTKDPETRYTDSQTPVTRFTLAVDRTFKREGQASADFIQIVVFGKSAENCGRYVRKGRLVAVSGRLQSRSWDDQSGIRHYATEVIADEVDFLDRPKDGGQGTGAEDTGDFRPCDEEDDLPF